jgi:hypothetical protein
MCLTPVLVKRAGALKSAAPYFFEKVPCGKCPPCRSRRVNGWAFRLKIELKDAISATFATFTYEDTPLSFNGIPTLNKRDFQLFMKRLRKRYSTSTGIKIKYYAAGEYGENTQRPHYHAIMFNIPQKALNADILAKYWSHGHVHIAPVNEATIRYTLKYLHKGKYEPQHELDDREPEFQLISKGIGKNYLTPENINFLRRRNKPFATIEGGINQTLPRYFKEKIWTQSERKALAAANPVPEVELDEHTKNERIKHAFNEQKRKK